MTALDRIFNATADIEDARQEMEDALPELYAASADEWRKALAAIHEVSKALYRLRAEVLDTAIELARSRGAQLG